LRKAACGLASITAKRDSVAVRFVEPTAYNQCMADWRTSWAINTLTLALATVACAMAFADEEPRKPPSPVQKALAREAREELTAFLPDDKLRERVADLIEDLGNEVFQVREDAHAALTGMPNVPIDLLRAATKSPDAEVRWRAIKILQSVEENDRETRLTRTFVHIQKQRLPGLADIVLQLMPPLEREATRRAAEQALRATASENDVRLLRRSTQVGPTHVRAAALSTLVQTVGEDVADELLPFLADDADEIRLLAARELALLSRRECLPVLGRLLDSEDLAIRVRCHLLLQAITGQRHGYLAYDDEQARADAAKRWRDWLAEHGNESDLKFPPAAHTVALGKTILCVWAEKKLIEIDATGTKTFETGGFRYPWGCQGLPNGHRLICDSEQRCVIEYDAAGNEIWRKGSLPGGPGCVQRLASGNTLISMMSSGQVMELAPSGRIVWQVQLAGGPTTAQRLGNGNTLVNLQTAKKVVEIDPNGKTVWQLEGLNRVHTAQGLVNGNVLTCDMNHNKVVEYDRQGKIVWELGDFSNPAQAQRLANGNTLVGDSKGLHEYTPDKRRIWHYPISRSRFHRF